jgi:hypothetical protein
MRSSELSEELESRGLNKAKVREMSKGRKAKKLARLIAEERNAWE